MNIVPTTEPFASRWKFKNANLSEIDELKEKLNIHPVLCQLLVQRGIKTYEEAKRYFRPSIEHLHNPFLMADMQAAVDRIEKALQANEKILIYGDYDVDGTTSVALVYSFFRRFYQNIDYYIPDRYSEGYGISSQSIAWAKERKISLIIALDCGIKSIDKIDEAKALGIDYIICDHHRAGEELPKAVAVLDPKRDDCPYPFKELSGCGIGFKLIQAFSIHNNIPEENYMEYIDLVSISIAADLVPVIDENRVLAYYGIEKINANPSAGIKALMDVSKLQGKISMNDLVFSIGPRINAAGRIRHGNDAVKLLVSTDVVQAEELATTLHDTNTERRDLDDNITKEALEMLHYDVVSKNKNTTVLFKRDWHKGVIGIVASRMIENYYRPTIILTESNGKAVGSARSIPGIDVYNALQACSDLLEQFGGHTYAAGLALSLENVEIFKHRFEEVVSLQIEQKQEITIPEIQIDAVIDLDSVNDKFYKIIEQMAPFGPGNMRPIFLSENVQLAEKPRIVKDKHLKVAIQHRNRFMSGIAFGQANKFEMVSQAQKHNICFVIEENIYNGNRNLQMLVKDIKPAQ